MKLRTIVVFALGVVGGIYLTTKDGEKTQKKIKEYAASMRPVVKDLINKTDDLLNDVINLRSDELRANVEKRIYDLKDKISSIQADDISNVAKNTIKEATNMIRKIRTEVNLSSKITSKRMKYEKKTVTELRKIAKKRKIQLQPTDKKSQIIDKLVKQD
jgi:gas vesicle protein